MTPPVINHIMLLLFHVSYYCNMYIVTEELCVLLSKTFCSSNNDRYFSVVVSNLRRNPESTNNNGTRYSLINRVMCMKTILLHYRTT